MAGQDAVVKDRPMKDGDSWQNAGYYIQKVSTSSAYGHVERRCTTSSDYNNNIVATH